MGKIAFVFPGQGAQAVGMGLALYEKYPSARAVFDRAGEAVKKLCFEGSQADLDITVNAQPCLFTVDLACAAALNERGVYAAGAAGFSLGEIPALAHCGLLNAEQAFDLVAFRGEIMQDCAARNPGGMLAVMGLDAAAVMEICGETRGAYPANFNSEKQTVVAFGEQSFDALKEAVSARGGKAIRLATSGAFHCPFMDGAAAGMADYAANLPFGAMKTPLYANATARVYENPAALVARQINSPVLWRETIENMV
ncbi:MAG: ACP S-malonyltransferase, partial [Clostridiales bacterium]|nr:ACP S-malonyltransferase [Clostridiales bacterium]